MKNNITGKTYIGSSINLQKRLRNYFKISFLEYDIKKNKTLIYRSLLKHGYSNFSLEILEYCEPENVVSREQYYLDQLKPEYNILLNAGSSLGNKHSEETLTKMSEAKIGGKNPMFGKFGENSPNFGKVRSEKAGRAAQKISVFNMKDKSTIEYDSIKAASVALKIISTRISGFIRKNQAQPYKGIYI